MINALNQESPFIHWVLIFLILWGISKIILRAHTAIYGKYYPELRIKIQNKIIMNCHHQPKIHLHRSGTEISKITSDLVQVVERIWNLCIWNFIPLTLSMLIILVQTALLDPMILIIMTFYLTMQIVVLNHETHILNRYIHQHHQASINTMKQFSNLFQLKKLGPLCHSAYDFFKKNQSIEHDYKTKLLLSTNLTRCKIDSLGMIMLILNFYRLICYKSIFSIGDMAFVFLTSISLVEMVWQMGHIGTEIHREFSLLKQWHHFLDAMDSDP